MAYAPETGLIDPFGGRADIAARLIRAWAIRKSAFPRTRCAFCAGCASAAVLDFEIHPDTLQAMERLSPKLNLISAERVEAELMKLLAGPAASRSLILGRAALCARMPFLDDAGYEDRRPGPGPACPGTRI